jgi:hypothetical protein
MHTALYEAIAATEQRRLSPVNAIEDIALVGAEAGMQMLIAEITTKYEWKHDKLHRKRSGENLMSIAKTTKPGTVEKVIPPLDSRDPEKAQINIHGAEPLYQEIRIENKLKDENGDEVKLKEGAEVEVHVEAPKSSTIPKKD